MLDSSLEAGPSRLSAGYRFRSPEMSDDIGSSSIGRPRSSQDHEYQGVGGDPEENVRPVAKQARTIRSGKACLNCRSKKRKCGGTPPRSCPNCLKADEECSWAAQDGRSSAVRREKAQARTGALRCGSSGTIAVGVTGGIGSAAEASQRCGAAGSDRAAVTAVGIEDAWPPAEETAWLASLMGDTISIEPAERPASNSQVHIAPTGQRVDLASFDFSMPSSQAHGSSEPYFNSALHSAPLGQDSSLGPSAAALTPSSAQPFQLFALDYPLDLPEWPSNVDPFDLIMAMSSRMPMVEQTVASDGISPASDTVRSTAESGTTYHPLDRPRDPDETMGTRRISSASVDMSAEIMRRRQSRDKFVKVTWWRPHGQTAIAPGLKRMTLRVRVADDSVDKLAQGRSPIDAPYTPTGVSSDLFESARTPSLPIMRHLIGLFKEHFSSQFPFLDLDKYLDDLAANNGSVFLLNCIAATAARFSMHPAIALPHLKPHQYGNVFYDVAKDMLGSMLAVPLRETVAALVLLCHVGFANDSEAEEWMFAGMAVRLAVDLGLHLEPGAEQGISQEDRCLNRLLFWSVVIQDFALAFGTGRQTTFRMSEITQLLPTENDLSSTHLARTDGTGSRHPFIWAAKQMYSYGRLIELLNSLEPDADGRKAKEIQRCKIRAIREYAQLPHDMRWNVSNLQRHAAAGTAPAFLQIHLWMHTIIASGHLTGTDYLRRGHNGNGNTKPDQVPRSGTVTPNGMAASDAWRHSARTIGDVLVLSDVICPKAYCALPFCNQAFYVAGSCYAKELEQERQTRMKHASRRDTLLSDRLSSSPNSVDDSGESGEDSGNVTDLFKSILASVSTENIAGLREGLAKQTKYWAGVAWVAEALEQRVQGIGASEIDLVQVTEKIASVASIPDAGALHQSTPTEGHTL